jgi:hypothetical protein
MRYCAAERAQRGRRDHIHGGGRDHGRDRAHRGGLAMRRYAPAFAAGAIFGAGLLVAGMTRPARIVAFLDVGGAWDPSLAFVMIGAIAVFAIAYRAIARRGRTLGGGPLYLPSLKHVDGALIAGSAAFGVGWGLSGYCPGPAIVSAAAGAVPALVFVGAMIVGMALAGRRPG